VATPLASCWSTVARSVSPRYVHPDYLGSTNVVTDENIAAPARQGSRNHRVEKSKNVKIGKIEFLRIAKTRKRKR
jgi:hypothetical protein